MADLKPRQDFHGVVTEQTVLAVRIIYADGQEAALTVPAATGGVSLVLTATDGALAWLAVDGATYSGPGFGNSFGTSFGAD